MIHAILLHLFKERKAIKELPINYLHVYLSVIAIILITIDSSPL